jgi:membrane-bound lytic murein transglycosylase D
VYIRKNSSISGKGWLVSSRIYVDLGFGNTIVLYAADGKKGVPAGLLKTGGDVQLRSVNDNRNIGRMNWLPTKAIAAR